MDRQKAKDALAEYMLDFIERETGIAMPEPKFAEAQAEELIAAFESAVYKLQHDKRAKKFINMLGQ